MPSSIRVRAAAASRSAGFSSGNTASRIWLGVIRPRPAASNSSSSLATANRSSAGRSDTPESARPALAKVCSTAVRPSLPNSSRSVWRMWRRIAERARPVTVSERQSAGMTGAGPVITCTTSPLLSGVRSGFRSPLIFTPMAVSPTSVWTA